MQADVDREKSDKSWEKEREVTKRKDEEKTERNRRKREKRKAAKNKKEASGNEQVDMMDGVQASLNGLKPAGKKGDKKDQADTSADVEKQETPGVIIYEED